MLQRTVHLASVVFWISVPLLGLVLIFPWLRIDWLQDDALAVPVGASSVLLLVLTYTPGYVSPVSRWVDGERVVYFLVFFYTMGSTLAVYG